MSGAVKAVSKVVSAVIKPVSSLLGGLLGIKQPKMADANSEPGSQTLRSSKAPARYCLGRFSTGGVLAWGQEQGGSQSENEWLHLVYVLSEGAIAGVDEIWLGEQQIGSYGSRATYEVVTDPEQVNAFLLANSPGWRSSQIGKGLSFVRISLRYSPEVFPSGIPDVRIAGRGRTDIYDPRTGSTGYSENAALLILWYLRTVLGVPDDEIVMPTFADAANVSAEAVTNPGGGSSTRYVIGAVIGDDEAPVSVLEKMCRACDGRLIRIGGRWTLQVGAYYGPYDFTITEDMIAGAVQGRTEVDNDKAINTIHGTFIDPSQSWTETDYPPVQVAEWVTVDGAELAEDLPLGYVNNPYQAQRLASIKLRRMRNGGELTLPMNAFGYNCRPGRVVRVQLPSLNIDGEFIVTDWAMGSDGGCNVSVAAYGPDIFDDAVGTPYNPLGFIQLPAGGMAPPTGLTFTSDESAEVLQGVLRWIPPYASVEYFGVIIRDSDGVAIQTYQVPGAAAQCQVAGLPSGSYTMSVFARGAMARSAEATISVSIMGPPAPVTVTAQESFDSITIIPFNPGGLNGGTYEYFYSLSEVGSPENAIYLGEGGAFTHNGLSYNKVYHYYVRSRNAYGVSQFYYLTAKTVADPGLILEIIEGQIGESQLSEQLRAEIDLISGDGPGSVSDRVGELRGELESSVSDLSGAISDAEDRLTADIGSVSANVGALDETVSGIQSAVSDLGSDLQSSVAGLNDAIEDVDSRLTGRIENVASDIAGLGNSISDLYGQVAGLDDDLQGSVSSLNSQLAQLETQIADITGAEDWGPGQAYLAGTLVRMEGSLYRAEQDVPAGTPVTDEDYWRKVGDYASLGEAVASLAIQVSDIQSRVANIDGTLTTQVEKTDTLIAAARPGRADGEKADSLRGWQTQASITQRDRVEASGKEALAERLLVIDAQIGDARSQLSTLEQAFASETEATAGRLDQLAVELGTTTAGLQQEIQTRATETAALAQDIQAMQVALEDVATTEALQALTVEVERLGDDISSVAQSVTDLSGRIESTESGLEAVSGAVSGLQTSVSEIEGELSAQASDITALGVSLGTAADLAAQADGKADDALLGLESKADSTAVQSLAAEVQQLGDDVSANSGLITELGSSVAAAQQTADDALAGLGDKADSSAVQALTTEVQQIGEDVTANTGAITQLGSRLETAEDGIAGNAGALDSLTTEVSEIEGQVAAAAQRLTALEAEVGDTSAALSVLQQAFADESEATAGQLTALAAELGTTTADLASEIQTRASETAALSQDVQSLQAALGDVASAEALQVLTAEVERIGDDVSAVTLSVTNLAGRIADTETGLEAASTAISGLQTSVSDMEGVLAAQASDITELGVSIGAAADLAEQADGKADDALGQLTSKAEASALQALSAEVEQVGEGVASNTGAITQLAGRVESAESGIAGNADAVEALTTDVAVIDGKVTAAAEQASRLSAELRPERADGEKADSLRGWQSQAAITESSRVSASEREALAERLFAAEVQMGAAASQLSILEQAFASETEATANQLTALASSIGTTEAALQQEVSTRASETAALVQDVSALQAAMGDVASADALAALTLEVEELEGRVSSTAQDLVALSSSLDQAINEIASKADASALQALEATVTQQGDQITATAQSVTDLEATVNDEISAAVQSLQQAVADESAARASDIQTVQASVATAQQAAEDAQDDADLALQGVADNAAAVQQANQAIADEASARASAIQTVQAEIGTVADQAQDALDAAGQASQDASAASAAVQQVSQAVADLEGDVSTMWSVRMQVNQNGQYVYAGIGLGIENGPGGLQSQFLVEANRFALLNTIDGETTVPFVVENGQTIINSAVIKQADIINLIVTGVLQSPDYVPETSGFQINFVTSQIENNGSDAAGRKVETNTATRIYKTGVPYPIVEIGRFS